MFTIAANRKRYGNMSVVEREEEGVEKKLYTKTGAARIEMFL